MTKRLLAHKETKRERRIVGHRVILVLARNVFFHCLITNKDILRDDQGAVDTQLSCMFKTEHIEFGDERTFLTNS